jgi:hypothetical protein
VVTAREKPIFFNKRALAIIKVSHVCNLAEISKGPDPQSAFGLEEQECFS